MLRNYDQQLAHLVIILHRRIELLKRSEYNNRKEMIPEASPFRRLPRTMPRRQVLYCDALRLSAEMAGLGFERLTDLLLRISDLEITLKESQSLGRPVPEAVRNQDQPANRAVNALLDAYSVIDSAHRFREILEAFPYLKHNYVYELFMRRTKDVKNMRNIVQHLRGHVDEIAQQGMAALGTLTWVGPGVPGGPPMSWMLQAGTSYPKQRTFGPMIDFYGSFPSGEIADVCLTTAGLRVNLSNLVGHMRQEIRGLEPSLEEVAEGKERFGSDVLYSIIFVPVQKERSIPH